MAVSSVIKGLLYARGMRMIIIVVDAMTYAISQSGAVI